MLLCDFQSVYIASLFYDIDDVSEPLGKYCLWEFFYFISN